MALCCVLSELLSYLFTLNEFHINCFWHFSTNALMHEQKTCNPFSLTRHYALTTVYDVSIDKLHVCWAPALHTVVEHMNFCAIFSSPGIVFFFFFIFLYSRTTANNRAVDAEHIVDAARCTTHRLFCHSKISTEYGTILFCINNLPEKDAGEEVRKSGKN